MRKKTMVTGGAGFIGSHLCERLLKEGCQVVCIDNFHTGRPENIQHLINKEHFQFIEHDVTVPLPNIDVDEIYNLACPASPVHYQKSPIQTIKTSFLGTLHALESARKYQARFVQASTSEIYGSPSMHPQPETYWGYVNPIGMRSCYDEGKRAAETLIFDFKRTYDMDIRVARIFNTYGPSMAQDDGRVISNFICQALKGREITVYGTGSQTRSLCYIDDTINGLLKLMCVSNAIVSPINIGSHEEITIKDLANKIIELTSSQSKITFHPLPEDDPEIRRPDISLAYKTLGWGPETSLDIGLSHTINYFKSALN
ncbi:UDP-glucuronic acid decarboxylase family protein [Thermoproteota archaeon]